MEDFDAHGGLLNGSGYVVHYATVPADGRDGAHECGIGGQAGFRCDAVLWGLFQADDGVYRGANISVAGGFAAPGGAVNKELTVGREAKGRVVVVKQICPGDVFQP